MEESQVGVKEESQVAGRFLVLLPVGESRNVRLLHVANPSGELSQKDPLAEACGRQGCSSVPVPKTVAPF
jgi:hypothetical protein